MGYVNAYVGFMVFGISFLLGYLFGRWEQKVRKQMAKCKIEVNNMPEQVNKFVVARVDTSDMRLWYWGSWDEEHKARQAAEEIGGVVLLGEVDK